MKAKLWVAAVSALVASAKIVGAADPELISKTAIAPPATTTASGQSLGAEYSPDGSLILFSSDAPDLIDGVGNFKFQLFVRSRSAGTLRVVSTSASGELGNGASFLGGISADNRYVAFQSGASNLVANDRNLTSDIFLRDLLDGSMTLVSQSTNATGASITGNAESEYPQISRDGKWVVFESMASNLVAGDANGLRDIYAWNRLDGSLHLVSAGPKQFALPTQSSNFQITTNSRAVLFEAAGVNLVDTNRLGTEIYLRDLESETTRWVSAPATNLANLASASFSNSAISENGRYVVFVGTPTPPTLARPALVRVDLNADSAIIVTNALPYSTPVTPTISNDGQFIAWSNGTNIFRWNAAGPEIEQVDLRTTTADFSYADSPELSPDGRFVAFISSATDLVAGADTGDSEIYLRDMQAGVTRLVSHSPSGGPTDDAGASYGSFSADGAKLLFETSAAQIVNSDLNDAFDIFEFDIATSTNALLTSKNVNATEVTGAGSAAITRNNMSADWRYVVFRSSAKLAANDTNQTFDIYLRDRLSATTTLISVTPDGFSPGLPSASAMITSDGKWVIFETEATGLAGPTDTRTTKNVYARNLQTGEITNISGPQAASGTLLDVSANGRFVIVGGSDSRVNRHDLRDHSDIVISANAIYRACSLDGARVYYSPFSTSLNVRDFIAGTDLKLPLSGAASAFSPDGFTAYVRTAINITATNFSTGASVTIAASRPTTSVANNTGEIVAYVTGAGGSIAAGNVGFIDFRSGENVIISHKLGATDVGNSTSGAAVISPNGRFIGLESFASDLIADDTNASKDVFLYDRYTDRTTLLSHKPGSAAPGNSLSANPYFSPDGFFITFLSFASDFVSGDFNDFGDIFVVPVPNSPLPNDDSDNDGLPDWWERANFSTLKYSGDDDFDHDGFSNRAEFLAGTNPLDAGSALRIVGVSVETNGSRSIVWNSVAGKSYRVEFTSNLSAPTWTTVLDNVAATTDTVKAIEASANGGGYYRVTLSE